MLKCGLDSDDIAGMKRWAFLGILCSSYKSQEYEKFITLCADLV